MHAEREFLNARLLATQVVNLNLGVRDTAAEARLGVWLVLAEAVATSGTTTHLNEWLGWMN